MSVSTQTLLSAFVSLLFCCSGCFWASAFGQWVCSCQPITAQGVRSGSHGSVSLLCTTADRMLLALLIHSLPRSTTAALSLSSQLTLVEPRRRGQILYSMPLNLLSIIHIHFSKKTFYHISVTDSASDLYILYLIFRYSKWCVWIQLVI